MLLSFWHTTVTRIRPGTKIERGSSVPDWDNAEELEIGECLVQPQNTILSQDGRVLGIQESTSLCAPAGADIRAGDRIRYGQDVYTIIGEPLVWKDVGRLDHMQVNLQRWSG